MVAMYDYNPEVQSPQDNPDSELPFKKGQIITVVGEMVSRYVCSVENIKTQLWRFRLARILEEKRELKQRRRRRGRRVVKNEFIFFVIV